MSKLLLIAPASQQLVGKHSRKFHRRFPPLDLLITAAMFRERGWEVALNDLNANPALTPEAVARNARDSDFVVLTTNPYADWQCPSNMVNAILDFARTLPGDRLLITGNHGTHYPGSILERTGAKVVVREEPEMALLEAITALKDSKDLAQIPGISFTDGKEHRHNPSRKVPPMDELPSPAYDLVDLADYSYELLGERFAILEASRGCPFSCNFCNLSMFQKKYRKRSAERFLAEIDDLVEKRGCRSLYVFDLEFTINKNMVQVLCDHLLSKDYKRKYGFKWACQTRADSVNAPMLEKMAKSGCELIHFGVEAGNVESLKATNKRIDKDGIREGIRATQAAGIKTAAFFIFGHPGETLEQCRETLKFAIELNPTYASFHPLRPFPGSPLFESKYGKSPYWEEPIQPDLTYFTPEQEVEISKFTRKAYLRYYLRPAYLRILLKHDDWGMLRRKFQLFSEFLLAD